MKNTILLFLYFIPSISFSQQKMDVIGEARYKMVYNDTRKSINPLNEQAFVLLFNKTESHLKNVSVHVKDSLVEKGEIRETGDIQIDFPVFGKYVPALPFTIHRKNNEINFTNYITPNDCSYIEEISFQWKITKETKTINGFECIKATTTKWGRDWTAYYSPNHPFSHGPYKFYGLPGLIFEISDTQKDYSFELYRFKNRNIKNKQLYNSPKAKVVSKDKYEKIRHENALYPSYLREYGDEKTRQRMFKRKKEKEDNYNPIELTE